MTIGERIRYLRIQKNMKIQELASAANVTRQTVSRYETGADRKSTRLNSSHHA